MQTPVLQEEAAEPENHFSRLSGPAMMGRSAEPVRLAGVKSKLRPGQRRHVSAVHWRRTLRNRNAQEEVPEPERPQAKMPKGMPRLTAEPDVPLEPWLRRVRCVHTQTHPFTHGTQKKSSHHEYNI